MNQHKEEAKELMSKFRDENYHFESAIIKDSTSSALLFVNGMIKEYCDYTYNMDRLKYWNQVKTELKNIENEQ